MDPCNEYSDWKLNKELPISYLTFHERNKVSILEIINFFFIFTMQQISEFEGGGNNMRSGGFPNIMKAKTANKTVFGFSIVEKKIA